LICTKCFFDLYFKYFINLKTLELGMALPRCFTLATRLVATVF